MPNRYTGVGRENLADFHANVELSMVWTSTDGLTSHEDAVLQVHIFCTSTAECRYPY